MGKSCDDIGLAMSAEPSSHALGHVSLLFIPSLSGGQTWRKLGTLSRREMLSLDLDSIATSYLTRAGRYMEDRREIL